MMKEGVKSRSYPLMALFITIAIGIGISGYGYYRLQKAHITRHAFEELSTISELKAHELSGWRKERLGDGEVIAKNRSIADEVKRLIADSSTARATQSMLTWMESLKDSYDYHEVLLVDPDGTIRLPASQKGKLEKGVLEYLDESVKAKAPLLNRFYNSKKDGAVRLDLIAPIFDWDSESRPVIAFLVLEIDPYNFLFPFIQKWPTPSKSAETYLVSRDGNEVTYLNELRHRKDTALKLRFSLSSSNKEPVAAMAVQGKEGVVEGIDYRGVPVLAFLGAIPESPWFIVSKVDISEAFAPIRDSAKLIVLMAGLMVALAAAGIGFFGSHQRTQLYREQARMLENARIELDLKVNERTAELLKANKQLQDQADLLNLAHDAILVRSIDDRVKFWSKGASETYGFTMKEAMGRITHELLQTVFPQPQAGIRDQVIRLGRWQGEVIHTNALGEKVIVDSRWALQTDSDGKPSGFLEINRDITARKRAEEYLKANMERLELINQELQEFAFVASHDLQEPLRKIQTFCDLTITRCSSSIDDTSQEYLERVINSALRMRQLLDDLLQFSRIAARPKPFEKRDLGLIVKEAAQVFEHQIKETGSRIEIDELPKMEVDEGQMLRLFQNLIGNALKFHSDLAPVIRVSAECERDRYCEIFVEDNGIGFEQQYSELIFRPFQRLHGRSKYEGTGMGLAICRKIVERHGGTIRAESEPEKGSKFIVRLPVEHDLEAA